MKKGRLARAGDLWPERFILWSITSKNSFICSAGGLRGFSLNFLTLKHLLLFLGITQQSTNRWIWWCQKDRIITIQQLTLVFGRRTRKGAVLLYSSAISNCEPRDFNRLRASAAVGTESREADGCPSFLEKRDRRERSFLIEKAHSARILPPQRHRVRALRPNNRRNNRVCHRVSNNEDTDPHTSWTPC